MWSVYGVKSPIWGYTTSRTTRELSDVQVMALKEFSEPRIEPEIMFGLGAAPAATMSDSALIDCVEWVALGYEIVQSIFPNWKFSAADTVAANSIHGALLIGPRHAIAPRKAEWQFELSTFEVELYCNNGNSCSAATARSCSNSPLKALRHLVDLLANDPHNPPLSAGEIISTGTLTLAMPIKSGERWTTTVAGIPLEEITVRFF